MRHKCFAVNRLKKLLLRVGRRHIVVTRGGRLEGARSLSFYVLQFPFNLKRFGDFEFCRRDIGFPYEKTVSFFKRVSFRVLANIIKYCVAWPHQKRRL